MVVVFIIGFGLLLILQQHGEWFRVWVLKRPLLKG